MAILRDASTESLRAFLVDHVEPGATVITDGWQSYRGACADDYTHERFVAPGRQAAQLMPGVHRVASLAKRWLLGTHQGSIDEAHLPAYLNEFVFRFNRRRSRSRGLVFYRVLELAVAHEPVRYRELVLNPKPKRIRRAVPGRWGQPPTLERPPAGRPMASSLTSTAPVEWIPQTAVIEDCFVERSQYVNTVTREPVGQAGERVLHIESHLERIDGVWKVVREQELSEPCTPG